jgi:hypothetical protein
MFGVPERARRTVRISGHNFDVGSASGSALECLFDSVRQGLPMGHAQGQLSAVELRDWLVAQYLQRQGAVPNAHIQELKRGGMGNLTDDVPALAVLLQVRIRIFVQGSSGDVWLEFDSAGGDALPVINILHQGIHFVPLNLQIGLPRDDGQGLRIVPSRVERIATSERPTTQERFGSGGSVSRRLEHERKVTRIESPIRNNRRNDSSPYPSRRPEERCDFCRNSVRDGRRLDCVSSRPCRAWRLACYDCYREYRDSYRCSEHKR